MNLTLERRDASGIVPFYADPELAPDLYAKLATQTLRSIAHLGLLHQVILVDDGDTLRGGVNLQDIVETVRLDPHGGKAEAVRFGIARVITQNPDVQYLIQSDFDGDPNPRQAQRMLRELRRNGISGDQPAMILGERDEALIKRGYLDDHRKIMFTLQKRFCTILGYPHITDPTTGLRVYTRALAEHFLGKGKAADFGSDVEQLVIARLVNATVLPHKLREVRRRADFTPVSKFRDCQTALLLHADELRGAGLVEVVDMFSAGIDGTSLARMDLQLLNDDNVRGE